MNCRKKHNVILTSLIVLGLIFLFSQKFGDDQDVYQEVIEPLPSSNHEKPLRPVVQVPDSPDTENGIVPALPPLTPDIPILDLDVPALPPTNAKQAFQEDLDLDLPFSTLQELSKNKPHNYHPNGPKTNAFATLLTGKNPSLRDPYFLAVQQIVYRTLWSQRSRTHKYPIIVYVLPHVSHEQRDALSGAGAVVRELAPVEWHPIKEGIPAHWQDLFVKLRLWKEVEFERIILLDGDAFPFANLDDMFNAAPVQQCKAEKLTLDDLISTGHPLCENYIFAGIPQQPWERPDSYINCGVILFTPSLGMHERLMQNYVKTTHYDNTLAEQTYLDWQFRLDGPFPPSMLDRKWGAYFPQEDEEGKLNLVHEKIWTIGPDWVLKDFRDTFVEMAKWYASPEFQEARKSDGVGA